MPPIAAWGESMERVSDGGLTGKKVRGEEGDDGSREGAGGV